MCLNSKSYGGKWTIGSFPWVILGFKVLGKIVWYHAEKSLFPTLGDPYVSIKVIFIPALIKWATAWVPRAAPKPWPSTLKWDIFLHDFIQPVFLFVFLDSWDYLGVYVKICFIKSLVNFAFWIKISLLLLHKGYYTAINLMLRAQFFNDDRSLPRKDKTKLIWKKPMESSFLLTAMKPRVFWVELTKRVTFDIYKKELLQGTHDQSSTLTGLQYAATAR